MVNHCHTPGGYAGEELGAAVEEWQAKRSQAGGAPRLTTGFLDGTHPIVDAYELKVSWQACLTAQKQSLLHSRVSRVTVESRLEPTPRGCLRALVTGQIRFTAHVSAVATPAVDYRSQLVGRTAIGT